MKKLLITISFVLNIILAGSLLYVGGNLLNKNLQHATEQQAAYRIAVMQPAVHPSMDEITQGFIETLEKALPSGCCECTVFNANNNVMLMRSQLEEVIQQKFDLLMTIGSKATQLAKEVVQKKESSIPIVFTAVGDAIEQGVVQSLECSGNQLTGIIEEPNFKEQMDLLFILKPTVKNILLVFNPSQGGLVKEADVLEQILKEKGIMLSRAEVFHSNEVYQKISGLVSGIDAVLILKDHTTVTAVESLAKLCNSRHVPLMASDLDSPARGAVLGFGVFERQFGIQGAQSALKILVDKKLPAQIPCSATHGCKLRINTALIKSQGLDISDDEIKIFKAIDVID